VRARGERASKAGSRRQSRENGDGLLVIPRESFSDSSRAVRRMTSGEEGALVEGRRPDSWRPSSLTRRRLKRIWLFTKAGLRPRGGGARHRASEATLPARLAVENTAAGRHRSEGPSIAAPARTERCSCPCDLRGSGPGARREVATTPKLEGRRQAKLHSGRPQEVSAACGDALTRGPQGSKEARSRIDESEGCSCRRSVADVGETHLSHRAPGPPQGDRDRVR
jgi:hypothetical protein